MSFCICVCRFCKDPLQHIPGWPYLIAVIMPVIITHVSQWLPCSCLPLKSKVSGCLLQLNVHMTGMECISWFSLIFDYIRALSVITQMCQVCGERSRWDWNVYIASCSRWEMLQYKQQLPEGLLLAPLEIMRWRCLNNSIREFFILSLLFMFS